MKIDALRRYCDTLPGATHDVKWGADHCWSRAMARNTAQKVSFLLAEQNTMVALRFADFGYILENGRVVMEGTAASLSENEDVKEFYLGISSGGRKSFRETKNYRRRKRWLA